MVYVNGQEMLFSTLVTGGSGKAIIDCEILPTEDINIKSFYRTPDGLFWNDGEEWHKVIEDNNIVVPDVNTSNRGTAGLIHMYNESSGLRLDENKRLCVASANQADINAGISVNKPIVPATIKYAIQNKSYKGDMTTIPEDEADTPPSALVVKNFVESKEVETYTGDFSDVIFVSDNANKPAGAFAVKQYVNSSQPVTFKGDIDTIDDDSAYKNDAPSVMAVKNFVENKIFDEDISDRFRNDPDFEGHELLPTVWSVNERVLNNYRACTDIIYQNVMPNLLGFKLAIVPRGQKFYVTPGMIALVLPWENHTSFHQNDGTSLMSNMGTTMAFATDNMNTSQEMDDSGNGYRVALIYATGGSILSGKPIASNHNYYSFDNEGNGCYFQNDDTDTSGTGWTYIYYLSRN